VDRSSLKSLNNSIHKTLLLLYRSKIAVTLLVALIPVLPASVFATPVAQQGEFKVSVAGTATGSIPHEIPLKMTQIPGGQLSETTGFAINPENVVQVKQGENLVVTTSENLKVNNVRARNAQSLPADLLPMPNNLWSLQSLVPGVYLLDDLPPMTVINQLSIIIEDGPPLPPDNNTPPPEPPTPCPPETMVNGVCPPTDEITPPPEPPTPDCPEAGPEICPPEEDIPIPPEEPPPEDAPDSGGDGSGNGNGDDGDGSNDDGSDGGNGETFE
jgi:hypothetical protein